MKTTYWISQGLVLLAYILLGFGLRKKKRVDILIYSSFFQVLMFGQYILLSGISGAISCIIALIRNMIFIYNEYKQKENSKGMLVIFSIITLILTTIFYTTIIDIVPCVLTILGIYVYWCTSMRVVRLGNIGISICYVIYAISLQSWFSIVCESYLIINTLIGYFKYEGKTKSIDSKKR